MFITRRTDREGMQEITRTKKLANGIVVYWDQKGESLFELYDYQRLIDMKVNALDLLRNTRLYRVDELAHRIVPTF